MSILLNLQGVIAGYDYPTTAKLSVTIARGEVIGLSGANGIGKSTILKTILGSAKLFSGTIERAINSPISYLSQQPVRLNELPLTGYELLKMLAANYSQAPSALLQKLPMRIDRLSGGEYQLLCLWATLSRAADIVLLDEPTNNLDQHHINTAIEEILLTKQNSATLVVSHDQDFLNAICTNIIKLNRELV